jgi:hypothetical protein
MIGIGDIAGLGPSLKVDLDQLLAENATLREELRCARELNEERIQHVEHVVACILKFLAQPAVTNPSQFERSLEQLVFAIQNNRRVRLKLDAKPPRHFALDVEVADG